MAKLDLEMIRFDVKTAFLHGSLEEEIFMQQPEGYETQGKNKQLVCRLNKSIHGLKQASRQWNRCFTDFLREFSLRPLKSDNCLFVSQHCDVLDHQQPLLIVCIYVDDGLVMSNRADLMEACISHLKLKFEITYGAPDTFVGLRIKRDRGRRLVYVDQEFHVRRLLDKFGLNDANQITTPMCTSVKLTKDGQRNVVSKDVDVPYRQLLGALSYVANGSRPDISYAINKLARFSTNPKLIHWECLKRVAKYLVGKEGLSLSNEEKSNLDLVCYSDADFANDADDRKSTSGFIVMFDGMPVTWKSSKQRTVATSTCEAEFISAAKACKELLWCRNLLMELGMKLDATKFFVDNKGTIQLIQNEKVHMKTKHLDIAIHSVRDVNKKGVIQLVHVPTDYQLADILTKALSRYKHQGFLAKLGLEKVEEANLVEEMWVLISFLMIVNVGQARSWLLGPEYVVQPHEVNVGFDQVCDFLIDHELEQEIKEMQRYISEELKTGLAIYPRSRKLYQHEDCGLKYVALIKLIRQMPKVANKLTKRSINEIYANSIIVATNVISGATIWLKGMFNYVVKETAGTIASELLSKIIREGLSRFDTSLVPMDIVRKDIEDVSIFVTKRGDFLDQAVKLKKPIDKFVKYVDEEYSAAEILLGSILSMLKKGKMDTEALGELIESEILMRIDPNTTRIRDVVLSEEKNLIKFNFDEIILQTFLDRIILADVVVITGSVTSLGILGLGVYLYLVAKMEIKVLEAGNRQMEMEVVSMRGSIRSRPGTLRSVARQVEKESQGFEGEY